MLAWVTSGFTAPGVNIRSGSTAPTPGVVVERVGGAVETGRSVAGEVETDRIVVGPPAEFPAAGALVPAGTGRVELPDPDEQLIGPIDTPTSITVVVRDRRRT